MEDIIFLLIRIILIREIKNLTSADTTDKKDKQQLLLIYTNQQQFISQLYIKLIIKSIFSLFQKKIFVMLQLM